MMEEKIQYFPNNKRNQFHMSVPNFFAIRSLCSVCCCPPLCSKTTIPTPPLPRSFDSVPALPHVDVLRISYLSLTLFTSRSRQRTDELDWSTCWTTGKIKIRFDCPVCPASALCCWSNNINTQSDSQFNIFPPGWWGTWPSKRRRSSRTMAHRYQCVVGNRLYPSPRELLAYIFREGWVKVISEQKMQK